MSEYTRSLLNSSVSEELQNLRDAYREQGVPVILDESLNVLIQCVSLKDPKEILEIGTATGCSGVAMLGACGGKLTTLETESDVYLSARDNFRRFGVEDRVTQYYGDAGEIIESLDKTLDFIFLDGPKAHYLEYLPRLKNMLAPGGVLLADNVLFRGYVDPANKFPRRFITIVKRMRKFLAAVSGDPDFVTSVLEVGDGILIACKRKTE